MDGTAVYYWFRNPVFGAPGWLSPITDPLVANAYTLGLMTWGTIVVEMLLAMALFMSPTGRRVMFYVGCLLHLGFGLVFGLASFSIVMLAALLLFTYDPSRPLDLRWPRALTTLVERFRRAPRRASQP
jgi:antimicrobial peptide system SdpB family protein